MHKVVIGSEVEHELILVAGDLRVCHLEARVVGCFVTGRVFDRPDLGARGANAGCLPAAEIRDEVSGCELRVRHIVANHLHLSGQLQQQVWRLVKAQLMKANEVVGLRV